MTVNGGFIRADDMDGFGRLFRPPRHGAWSTFAVSAFTGDVAYDRRKSATLEESVSTRCGIGSWAFWGGGV